MSPGDPEHAPLPLPAPVPITEAEQLHLAKILMTPGTLAHRMGRKNGSIGTAPVEDAVRSGRPFFVQAEHLVLDVDRADANRALVPFIDRVSQAGVTPVIIRTGRLGHRQLMAWVDDGRLRGEIRTLARATPGVMLKTTARVPGTPHRISECPAYALQFPSTVAETLAALRRPPERRLSRRMTRLLEDGIGSERYESGSELRQALVLEMRRKGWTPGSIRHALLDPRHHGGRSFRGHWERDREDAKRRLTLAIEAADGFISTAPRDSLAQRIRRTIMRLQVPGRTGGVDTAVLHAIGSLIILRSHRLSLHAGSRDIAELAGVTRKTASKALHRLARRGWLTALSQGAGQNAAEWRLDIEKVDELTPLSGVQNLLPVTPGSGVSLTPSELSHDLWRYRLLGKRRALLFVHTLSTDHAVKLTGADRQRVRRLISLKMAKPDVKRGWFWKLDCDLDQICRILGLEHSLAEQQRTKHAEERERYREHLNDHVLKRLTPELAWYRRRQKHLGVIEGGKE